MTETSGTDPLDGGTLTRELLDDLKQELKTLRRLRTDAVSIFRMMGGRKPDDRAARMIDTFLRTDPSTGEVAPVGSIFQ